MKSYGDATSYYGVWSEMVNQAHMIENDNLLYRQGFPCVYIICLLISSDKSYYELSNWPQTLIYLAKDDDCRWEISKKDPVCL